MILRFKILSLGMALVAGCGKMVIDDPKTQQEGSTVSTSETNGVITAEIKSNASDVQLVVTAKSSTVAASSVSFPQGALSVTTSITVGAGAEALTKSALTELGVVNALADTPAKTVPLNIGALAVPTLAKDAEIRIPLPLTTADLEKKSTSLAGKYSLFFLSIVYKTANTKVVKLKKLTVDNLIGTFVRVGVSGIGWFQVLLLPATTTESEKTTSLSPAAK